jgi:opacity protein-like surface antigen
MRIVVTALLAWMAVSGVAQAQTGSASDPTGRGYVEGIAQSAFGSATSQSYGAEAGVTVFPNVQLFVEAGRVANAAPSTFSASAAVMAGYLSQTQSNVTFGAKEPITFGLAGLRYVFPASGKLEPYVLAGGGVARVQKNATFAVGGSDVTGNLSQYNVVLGTDLSGSENSAMLSLGGGVMWTVRTRIVLDLQYRYGRVFAARQGINVNRAGAGIGVRF